MAATNPKGGLYAGTFASYLVLDPDVRSLLSDHFWTSDADGQTAAKNITYYFPQSVDDYPVNYTDRDGLSVFQVANEHQQDAAFIAFNLIGSYTNLVFVKSDTPDAALRIAGAGDLPGNKGGSHAGYPQVVDGAVYNSSGDAFLGPNGTPTTAQLFGEGKFSTVLHEIGHALGLKHPFELYPNGQISAAHHDIEFSLMSYSSFLSGDVSVNANTGTWEGSSSAYMMYDIAALQEIYGANFSKGADATVGKVAEKATYTWDNSTGQQFINGVADYNSTGTTDTYKIFQTVWTQGADTTYDLSNFDDDQYDDLRPGHWLRFSVDQLADLNDAAPEKTPEYRAQGNVYNSLLYHGDMRSEIGTLVTGAGNDTIIGNDLNNVLYSGNGNDTIDGGAGNDFIYAGNGDDVLIGGFGVNQLWGGDGNDTASYAGRTGVVYADLIAGSGKVDYIVADTYNSIENLIGGSGRNTLVGDVGNNRLTGGASSDLLYGGGGDDTLIGGGITAGTPNQLWGQGGADTASYEGTTGRVYADLRAQAGYVDGVLFDTMQSIENLIGGSAADTLIGDSGANALRGGGGADSLRGMGGADVFVYGTYLDSNLMTGYDTIADFVTGLSKLDLRAFNTDNSHIQIQSDAGSTSLYLHPTAGTSVPSDLAINFIGANAIVLSDILFA